MRNWDICIEILRRSINVHFKDVNVVNPQKPLDIAFHGKSIFLTMYAEDDAGDIYNIELHYTDVDDILQQSQFYKPLIYSDTLENKGKHKTAIIFICKFDPFGLGEGKYTFCAKNDIDKDTRLSNSFIKVFLNIKGRVSDPLLQDLLEYMDCLEIGKVDSYTQALNQAVKEASQSARWRGEYTMISMRDMRLQNAAMEKGIEKGIEEGRQYERFQMLCAAARRGMTDDQLKTFLDATPEELLAVKEELSN